MEVIFEIYKFRKACSTKSLAQLAFIYFFKNIILEMSREEIFFKIYTSSIMVPNATDHYLYWRSLSISNNSIAVLCGDFNVNQIDCANNIEPLVTNCGCDKLN